MIVIVIVIVVVVVVARVCACLCILDFVAKEFKCGTGWMGRVPSPFSSGGYKCVVVLFFCVVTLCHGVDVGVGVAVGAGMCYLCPCG